MEQIIDGLQKYHRVHTISYLLLWFSFFEQDVRACEGLYLLQDGGELGAGLVA